MSGTKQRRWWEFSMLFPRGWGVGKVLHFSKSAVREHIAYIKASRCFTVKVMSERILPVELGVFHHMVGGFLWFSFQGHSESSEKHKNVGDVVKSPFYIEVGGGSRWAGLQASEVWWHKGCPACTSVWRWVSWTLNFPESHLPISTVRSLLPPRAVVRIQ